MAGLRLVGDLDSDLVLQTLFFTTEHQDTEVTERFLPWHVQKKVGVVPAEGVRFADEDGNALCWDMVRGVEGVSFDQILDLDTLPDSNKAETEGLVGMPTPIIAFEESITQQNNTAGNDDPSYPSEILCRGEMPYKGARHGSGSTTMEEFIFHK